MNHPLDGPRAKVIRAREHLDTLKRESAPFRGALRYGEHYDVFSELDPQTRKFALRLHVIHEPPLLRYGILVGDFVHQCRSAMDNLIAQATIAHHGSALPKTEFPVFDNPADYTRRKKNGDPAPGGGLYAIRGIDPALWDLVEKLQPYNRTASGQPRPLGILHDFWNMDKHRIPPVVAAGTNASYPKVNLVGVPHGSRDFYLMMLFPFEEGVNLVEVTLLPDETERQMKSNVKVKLSLNIEFDEGPLGSQTGRRYPVIEALELLLTFTDSLIADFAQFFP